MCFLAGSFHELIGLLEIVDFQDLRAMLLKLIHDGWIQIDELTGRDQDLLCVRYEQGYCLGQHTEVWTDATIRLERTQKN